MKPQATGVGGRQLPRRQRPLSASLRPGPDGRPWHSWRILILPYIEAEGLFEEYGFSEPWDGPNNRQLAGRMPRLYAFHGDERPGNTTTNYLAVIGPETAWPGASTVSIGGGVRRAG